jgi:hypothetical protein
MKLRLIPPVLLVFFCAPALYAQQPVNPDSLILQDFHNRVADYVKLHQQVQAKLPALKPTDSPAAIAQHQAELASAIRDARPHARPGEIFTPKIGAEFRRLIGMTMRGRNAARIRASLRHAEPVRPPIAINGAYPLRAGVPLQSTPPTLLLNLPPLPKDVEYRIVGTTLVLLDVKANLIVDFLPRAIPATGGARK